MPTDATAVRLVALIAEVLRIDATTITLESRFVEDLGASSLDLAEILSLVEGDFHCTMPDELLGSARTVADVLVLLTRP